MRDMDIADEMPGSYEIYIIGDTHIGNIGYKRKRFAACRRRVRAKKNAYVIDVGDGIEAITPDDPRFSVNVTEPKMLRIDKQIEAEIAEKDPIADRIKLKLYGNHEYTIMKKVPGFNPAVEVSEGLGVKYPASVKPARAGDKPKMGDSFQIKLNLPTVRVLCRHHHKTWRSQSQDEHMIKEHYLRWLEKQQRPLASDCEVMVIGHTHTLGVRPPIHALRMVFDPQKGEHRGVYPTPTRIPIPKMRDAFRIEPNQVWYCSTGAWLGSYETGVTTYAEFAGFPPTELGAVRMVVKNDKLQYVEEVPF